MGMVYSIILLIVIVAVVYGRKPLMKMFAKIDEDEKLKDVNEKMDDLAANEEAVKRIDKFQGEHKGADKAGAKVEKFLKK